MIFILYINFSLTALIFQKLSKGAVDWQVTIYFKTDFVDMSDFMMQANIFTQKNGINQSMLVNLSGYTHIYFSNILCL